MKIGLMNCRSAMAAFGVLAGLIISSFPQALAQNANSKVFPPHANMFGRTYGEWSASWWQYILSIPAGVNPLNDTTGQFCEAGQPGKVHFLAGTFVGDVTRECTVRVGKAVFLPIINVECSTVEDAPFQCTDELSCRTCAAGLADGIGTATLSATIDGVAVQGLSEFRVQSPFFKFTLPANDVLGKGPATGFSVSDGYWLMLKPLPRGEHTVHIFGEIPNVFTQNVSYTLRVENPGVDTKR